MAVDRRQGTVCSKSRKAVLSFTTVKNLNALAFTLLGKSTFEVVPRSKPLCKIAVSKHGFETAMQGKLLFSPHPLALICEVSRLTPRPEGKTFLTKKFFPLDTLFKKLSCARPFGGFDFKRCPPLKTASYLLLLISNLYIDKTAFLLYNEYCKIFQ